MKKILNIGYGNTVIVSTIQAIVSYDSSPSKSDYVVLSALSVDALRKRLEEE